LEAPLAVLSALYRSAVAAGFGISLRPSAEIPTHPCIQYSRRAMMPGYAQAEGGGPGIDRETARGLTGRAQRQGSLEHCGRGPAVRGDSSDRPMMTGAHCGGEKPDRVTRSGTRSRLIPRQRRSRYFHARPASASAPFAPMAEIADAPADAFRARPAFCALNASVNLIGDRRRTQATPSRCVIRCPATQTARARERLPQMRRAANFSRSFKCLNGAPICVKAGRPARCEIPRPRRQ